MRYFALLAALFTFGCASNLVMKTEQLSEAQKSYLAKAMAQPLEFDSDKSKSDEIWGRATEFVANHSSMKIQIATDFLIETYNPTSTETYGGTEMAYGYKVSRRPIGSKVHISVTCVSTFHAMYLKELEATRDRNAHILAYFLVTGELPFPDLIKK